MLTAKCLLVCSDLDVLDIVLVVLDDKHPWNGNSAREMRKYVKPSNSMWLKTKHDIIFYGKCGPHTTLV